MSMTLSATTTARTNGADDEKKKEEEEKESTRKLFDEAFLEMKQVILNRANSFVPCFERMTEEGNKVCDLYGDHFIALHHPRDLMGPIHISTVQMTLFDALDNFIRTWHRAVCTPRFPAPGTCTEYSMFGTQPGETLVDTVFHVLQLVQQVPMSCIWRVLSILLSCTPSSPWLYHQVEAKQVAVHALVRVFPQLSTITLAEDTSLRGAVSCLVYHAGSHVCRGLVPSID